MAEAAFISELRQRCQQHKWSESRGLTRLHRYVSIYVTACLVRTPISANALTVLSIITGLGGSLVLAALPDFSLVGVALLYASFLLDQVDGEVARYRNATSLSGSYLDELRHIFIYAAPIFAIAVRLVTQGAHVYTVLVGFCAAMSLIVLRFNSNVKYLLFTKKLLALANGAVRHPGASERRVDRDNQPRPARSNSARRAYSLIAYVLTNQICLLGLLLVFVAADAFVGLGTLVAAYVAYAILLCAVAIVDCSGMAISRIERSCQHLTDTLAVESGPRSR